jgi:nucleoside-diphosphate-sugar epimerase
MKILITGSSGFIGWELTKTLANQGHEIKAYSRRIPEELSHERVQWIVGDLNDEESMREAMRGCEQVYHMAGIAKMRTKNPNDFYKINVDGTENVLRCALKTGVNRVVFTSTCGVFGRSLNIPISEEDIRLDPFNNDYDLSKYMAEQTVKKYVDQGLDVVIVNPSRVFGPGKLSLANSSTKLIKQYLKGTIVAVPGTGHAISNFVFVEDIVNGHVKAMENGRKGERYIIGGHNISFHQLLDYLQELTGIQTNRLSIPVWVMRVGAALDVVRSKIFGSEITIVPADVSRFCQNRMLCSNKASEHFGYEITDIKTSLKKTVEYLRKNVSDDIILKGSIRVERKFNLKTSQL